jgi:hypothetical protein
MERTLDCDEYLANYLSAHADCELSAGWQRAADEHVRGCLACRYCLFDERYVKAMVHRTLPILRTPTELEARIRKRLREN